MRGREGGKEHRNREKKDKGVDEKEKIREVERGTEGK